MPELKVIEDKQWGRKEKVKTEICIKICHRKVQRVKTASVAPFCTQTNSKYIDTVYHP